MTKTVQKNISLIAGLFFIAQSAMVPVASAATILTDYQPSYSQAATSAAPVTFNTPTSTYAEAIQVSDSNDSNVIVGGVIGQAILATAADKVIDNSDPTIDDVKSYVLGEIKKAGLNVRQADALVSCESRWDYKAINNKNRNGTNDKGLWQINSIHTDISDADKLDYKAATAWAIAKRLNDGNWSAWSCASKHVAVKAAAVAAPVWE